MFESLATQDGQDPAVDSAGFAGMVRASDPAVDSAVDPGVDPVGFLTAAVEVLAKLPSQLWRTGNDGFGDIVAGMDALAVQLDCARVGLVQEALSRGVVDQSPAPTGAAWLLEHSVHLEPGDAARTVRLAQACSQPKNQVLAAAVAGGSVTVRKAMTALGQLAAVEDDLAPGGREQALGWLTVMAQTGHNSHVIAVGRRLMALLGADRALEHDEDKLRTLNSLRLTALENGMTAVSGRLDPESAAVLAAALDPLSAPNPCDANGGRDQRPADRRRAEALVEVCRRAAAAGGAAPATSKAQVVVLIDLEHLSDTLRGAGTTLTGQDLSPATVRKLACDASIIPIVLGSQGQPLDVGRTKRLVTPAQLAALWVRDKHCTYPGCTRQANWCSAHHVIHWIDGGPTALTNLALLCQHHHTYVHRWDLTATITTENVTDNVTDDVTWHT